MKVKELKNSADKTDIQQSCQICKSSTFEVLDLGDQPFANNLIDAPVDDINTYPLQLRVCSQCSAAQLSYFADANELYSNYLYITPDTASLTAHYEEIHKFASKNGYVNSSSEVLEIGSNIGHFLKYLKPNVKSVLGVDPAENVARMANESGINTVNAFFNKDSAGQILNGEGKKDVIVARHCFAHNEKPWEMIKGVDKILTEEGVFLIENAYFVDTVEKLEFDQIYHEHMYYYNVRGMFALLEAHQMKCVDVFYSPIHGGTIMFVAKRASSETQIHQRVRDYLEKEKNMHKNEYYESFVTQVEQNKKELLKILEDLKKSGNSISAYGASAKATTLLNYYGITADDVPYIIDSTEVKHNKYIPGANIKVISEEEAKDNPMDYYLLTSWNYKDEIINKVRSWGNMHTKFIMPHPKVEIV